MNAPFQPTRHGAPIGDHPFARLTRFVPSLDDPDQVCRLDRVRNINFVSKERFDELDASNQRRVFSAHDDVFVRRLE